MRSLFPPNRATTLASGRGSRFFRRPGHGDRAASPQSRRVTLAGRIVMIATLFSGLALVNRAATPWLATLLVAWVLHGWIGWRNRPRLQYRLTIAPDGRVGESETIELTVNNLAGRPLRDIHISFLSPGSPHRLEWVVDIDQSVSLGASSVPSERGYWPAIAIHAESRFPFGWLRWWSDTVVECPVWIAPRLLPNPFELQTHTADDSEEPEWQTLTQPVSWHGIEQTSVREYVPGMHVRRWHHASWARTQIPTVCDYATEAGPRFQIFITPMPKANRIQPPRLASEYEKMLSGVAAFATRWDDYDAGECLRMIAFWGDVCHTTSASSLVDPLPRNRLLAGIPDASLEPTDSLMTSLLAQVDPTLPLVVLALTSDSDQTMLASSQVWWQRLGDQGLAPLLVCFTPPADEAVQLGSSTP